VLALVPAAALTPVPLRLPTPQCMAVIGKIPGIAEWTIFKELRL
jgi:hypothetical protein